MMLRIAFLAVVCTAGGLTVATAEEVKPDWQKNMRPAWMGPNTPKGTTQQVQSNLKPCQKKNPPDWCTEEDKLPTSTKATTGGKNEKKM